MNPQFKENFEKACSEPDFYADSNSLQASKILIDYQKVKSSSGNIPFVFGKHIPSSCFTSTGTIYLIYNDFNIHTTHYTTHTQHTTQYTTRLNDKERWYKWQIRYA